MEQIQLPMILMVIHGMMALKSTTKTTTMMAWPQDGNIISSLTRWTLLTDWQISMEMENITTANIIGIQIQSTEPVSLAKDKVVTTLNDTNEGSIHITAF